MSNFIIGRLFGWNDFSNDGEEVWVVQIQDPTFTMRVIHRPTEEIPTGEMSDIYFPLRNDDDLALGNLIFLEPRPSDPRVIAGLVNEAINSIEDPDVANRLNLTQDNMNPSSADIHINDVPLGFIIGVMHDAEMEINDDGPWIINLAPPPFAMRLCDLNNEDLDQEDIWASLGEGNVFGHLTWLTNLACSRDDLLSRSETAANYLLDIANSMMPNLIPTE